MKRITKCPHCGSGVGLYVRVVLTNVTDYYGFDGGFQCENLDNGIYIQNKKMYCQYCHKYVMKFEEYQDNYIKDR